MREIFEKTWVRLLLVLLALTLICGRVYHNYADWAYRESLPRFHDVTLELGQEWPGMAAFCNEIAEERYISVVTDPETLDLSRPGTLEVAFRFKDRVETVTLTVQDTVAPEASFRDVYTVLGAALTPEDFLEEACDLDGYTLTFSEPLTQPKSYAGMTVEILVTDPSGNVTKGTCRLQYVWMVDAFTMELGDNVHKSDLLIDPEHDRAKLEQKQLDAVNAAGAGEYVITSADGDLQCQCRITVTDTTAPTLKLRELAFYPGETAEAEDFVVSAWDRSGVETLELLTELDFQTPGVQTVEIRATDPYGNETVEKTQLTVLADTTPPVIYGCTYMVVAKHSYPDFHLGVTAYDDRSGAVSVTVDASRVNTAQRGTYYVIYTARDEAGNVATVWRTVTVAHDAQDTVDLVASVAAKLPNDAEAIRDYVRDLIWYSGNQYGGGDPIWWGMMEQSGNCYVYANVFKALLEAKGYTCQLIWVTDQSHYWLQVFLNGKWVHMDATPGSYHSRYSIMNDAQRYETLKGRDWDRSGWPPCE